MKTIFLILLSSYGVGALAAATGIRGWLGRMLVAAGAVAGAGAGSILGTVAIFYGSPLVVSAPDLLQAGGAGSGLALRLDGLGAFFLILIGVGAIPAAIFGAGYSKQYEDGRGSLRMLGVMLNLFLLSMSLVAMADNVLTFLLTWEAMSLTSYFLVITEAGEEGVLRAGGWYVAMTHAGLALLLAAFVLLMGGGSGSFGDLREQAATLSPPVRNTVFILALLGFGSKAGLVPLHVWLPMAHPAAPSHVSALMSGVMIKMGIYGLLRMTIDLLGGGPVWWGGVVLGAGAVSALLGVLYALMEHDLKRLLAYHSVENIGIILIGIGSGMIFQSYGQSSEMTKMATLGLIGGLYHTINHATFKGLLFLGAGSVLHATHTRNMEEMGGLIKRMPVTALSFLIGSVAISALPPLNGFASEWVIFQSLLAGFKIPNPEVAVLMPAAVGMLALTSGLAAACFVKAFGITFLAIPRSKEAEHAHEAPPSMRAGMVILALACVALGLLPFLAVPAMGRVLAGLGRLPEARVDFTRGLTLAPNELTQISPTLVAGGLLILLCLVPVVMLLVRANRKPRVADSWGCGRIGQTPRMEYTATAFAEPLRRIFAELYRPTKELTIDFHPESKYFVQSIEYRSEITPWFEKYIYDPCLWLIRLLAAIVRRMQSGSLSAYLFYVVVALVVLLLSARW